MKKYLSTLSLLTLILSAHAQIADQITVINDQTSNPPPSSFSQEVRFHLKWNSSIGVPHVGSPGTGTYSTLMTIAPWSDATGPKHHQLNFNEEGLYWRKGLIDSSWEPWRKIITSDQSGNVDISRLDINGDGGQLRLSGGPIAGGVWTGGPILYMADWETGTKGVQVNMSTGNVTIGAGTSTPTSLLEVNGNIGVGMNAGSDTGYGTRLYFAGADPNSDPLWVSRYNNGINYSELRVNIGDDYGQHEDMFVVGTHHWEGSSWMPHLAVQASGNVGIGTTSPSSKLDVRTDVPNQGVYSSQHWSTNNPDYNLQLQTVWNDNGIGQQFVQKFNGTEHTVLSFLNGEVGIGTTEPDAMLAVKGLIHSREVKVDLLGACAPDYVFEKDYPLSPLSEVEKYVQENKHLPEVPSAADMETNGIKLMEMNLLLLKKVEELTLYVIEQQKQIQELQKLVQQKK